MKRKHLTVAPMHASQHTITQIATICSNHIYLDNYSKSVVNALHVTDPATTLNATRNRIAGD